MFTQAALLVGNKTRYSVLDGFPSSVAEGKALKRSRRGEETRKGETQPRKVGCKERQRDRPWVCWAALQGPWPFLFSLAFWRGMSGPHAPWPFIIRKKNGQINQIMKNENQDPQKENSCLLHEIAFKRHTLPAQERNENLLPQLPCPSLTSFAFSLVFFQLSGQGGIGINYIFLLTL